MRNSHSGKDQEGSIAEEESLVSRYWATTTMGVILAVLMLQFAVSIKRTEPYPAFIFPGFANVPFSERTAQIRDVSVQVTTERGDVHDLSYQQVFHTVPGRIHAYLLTIRLFSSGSILGWELVNSGKTDSSSTSSTEVYVLAQDREVLNTQRMPRRHAGRSTIQLRGQLRDYFRKHPAFDSLSTPDTLRVRWKQQVFNQQGFVREHVSSEYRFPLSEK